MQEGIDDQEALILFKTLISTLLFVLSWICMFLIIQYLARESDFSNVSEPEGNERFLYWGVIIVLVTLASGYGGKRFRLVN